MNALVIIRTQKAICFHDTFYCLGSDIEAVRNGVESINSYKRTYEQVKSTKEQMIIENDEIMCYPVVEPNF